MISRILMGATVFAAIVACGGKDTPEPTVSDTAHSAPPSPSPTRFPTATATATEVSIGVYPDSARTGLPTVDAVITLVIQGDLDGIMESLHFITVPCAAEPQGPIPQPPKCAAEETDGSLVAVMLFGSGESAYRRADDPTLRQGLESWLGASRHLFAVKELDQTAGLPGKYLVVFATEKAEGNSLTVSDQGIVWVIYDPSRNPRRIADSFPGTWVLPPH